MATCGVEPDLDPAAELMQQVAARRLELAVDPEVAAAGARYRARLEELWAQRQELGERLKWRAESPV